MLIKLKYIYACMCKLVSHPPPNFDSSVDQRSSLPRTPALPQPHVRLGPTGGTRGGQDTLPQACPDLGSWHVKSPLLLELSLFSRLHFSMAQVSGASGHQEIAGLNFRASQPFREHALRPKKPKGSWRSAFP